MYRFTCSFKKEGNDVVIGRMNFFLFPILVKIYSRTSVARTRLFELALESLGKNPVAADIIICRIIWDGFLFFFYILIMVCCVYSLESPRWGNSHENTQHTFMFKKIERYPYNASWPGAMIITHYSLAWTTHLEHIFMVIKVFTPLKFNCSWWSLI